MRKLSDVRGLGGPGGGVKSKDVHAKGFRAGQSRGYESTGKWCFAIAIIGWFVLLPTPLIWPWTIFWIVVLVVWVVVIWLADSDSPKVQQAQSNPGFDQGFIDRQAHDVIHEHDHH